MKSIYTTEVCAVRQPGTPSFLVLHDIASPFCHYKGAEKFIDRVYPCDNIDPEKLLSVLGAISESRSLRRIHTWYHHGNSEKPKYPMDLQSKCDDIETLAQSKRQRETPNIPIFPITNNFGDWSVAKIIASAEWERSFPSIPWSFYSRTYSFRPSESQREFRSSRISKRRIPHIPIVLRWNQTTDLRTPAIVDLINSLKLFPTAVILGFLEPPFLHYVR
jgi:hypothetical protein